MKVNCIEDFAKGLSQKYFKSDQIVEFIFGRWMHKWHKNDIDHCFDGIPTPNTLLF